MKTGMSLRSICNFAYLLTLALIKASAMINEIALVEVPPNGSDYETERNKPIPNKIHGAIQHKISVLLDQYSDRYLFTTEVSLDTTPSSTPDILIFPIKKLSWKNIEAKEKEMPITTIEIISPSQSIEELAAKAWNIYFPAGVRSAWIVVPPLKTVMILLPDDQELVFSQGELLDPTTGIQLSLERIFECMV